MATHVVVLTPKIARYLLEHHTGSKKVKVLPHKVERLVRLMVNKRFDSETYPLVFRTNDQMRKGVEVLHACIQANIDIKVEVSYSNSLWKKVVDAHGNDQ